MKYLIRLEKGINWNDFPPKYKRGCMVVKVFYEKEAVTPDGVSRGTAIRSRWVEKEIPILTKDPEMIPNNREILSNKVSQRVSL